MSLRNCPECKKEISDTVGNCPNCGYEFEKESNKKNSQKKCGKIIPWLFCGVAGIAVVFSIVWILYMSQWSLDNTRKIINSGSLECFLEHEWEPPTCQHGELCEKCGIERGELSDHTWQAATCTNPETCNVCGETRGEVLPHDWVDATCVNPKTCSACETTEGQKLGHTTRMGFCDRCDLFISELQDQVLYIYEWWEDIAPILEDVAWDLQYAAIYKSSTYLFDAIEKNREIADSVYDVIDYCGRYKEFSGAIDNVVSFKNSIPTYPDGLSVYDSEVPRYAADITDQMQIAMKYLEKMIDELSKLSK